MTTRHKTNARRKGKRKVAKNPIGLLFMPESIMGKGTGDVTEYSSRCHSLMRDDRENKFVIAILRV